MTNLNTKAVNPQNSEAAKRQEQVAVNALALLFKKTVVPASYKLA